MVIHQSLWCVIEIFVIYIFLLSVTTVSVYARNVFGFSSAHGLRYVTYIRSRDCVARTGLSSVCTWRVRVDHHPFGVYLPAEQQQHIPPKMWPKPWPVHCYCYIRVDVVVFRLAYYRKPAITTHNKFVQEIRATNRIYMSGVCVAVCVCAFGSGMIEHCNTPPNGMKISGFHI